MEQNVLSTESAMAKPKKKKYRQTMTTMIMVMILFDNSFLRVSSRSNIYSVLVFLRTLYCRCVPALKTPTIIPRAHRHESMKSAMNVCPIIHISKLEWWAEKSTRDHYNKSWNLFSPKMAWKLISPPLYWLAVGLFESIHLVGGQRNRQNYLPSKFNRIASTQYTTKPNAIAV